MKTRTLLIDDLRDLKADVIARNPIEGIKQLTYCGPWDTLLLDHDMATYDDNGREITGYDVLLWIEERLHSLSSGEHEKDVIKLAIDMYIPKEIKLVTDNASAREKMLLAIEAIYRKANQLKGSL